MLRNIISFHKEARERTVDEEHDVGGQQYIGIDFASEVSSSRCSNDDGSNIDDNE